MKKNLLPFNGLIVLPGLLLFFFFGTAQKSSQQLQEMRKNVLSDSKVLSVNFSQERQTPALIALRSTELSSNTGTLKTALNKYLNVRPGVDNLIQNKQTAVNSKLEVVEFQQYYKGVKVDRAGYKALVHNGSVSLLGGAFYDVPAALPVKPQLTEKQALDFAKQMVNAKKYAWEQTAEDLKIKPGAISQASLKQALGEYFPKAELVIIKDFTKTGVANMRLAYKFNIYAAQPLSRGWVYVDAENGKILLYDKIIKHFNDSSPDAATASSNATVQTRYAGTQVIKTKLISGNDPNSGNPLISSHPSSEPTYIPGAATYALIDDTRGKGIETFDLNNVGGVPVNVAALYLQGKSFTDVDNNWTLAQHHRSPANDGAMEAENDDIAWDAHWGAEVVYDYWKAKHNRLSYDGKDAKISNFIHYGPAYDNAFWNGTAMTYGDGSGTAASGFKALTSLDVCGHEIGHGVCSSTSDLIYQGESGAMNEALSDIWASCIEYFAMTRSGSTVPSTDYRPFFIGEQISANVNSPLRRMDNTKQQGNPDTYGGTNWVNPSCTPNTVNDQCGVHTNSGVLNKWFFLITAGSKTGTRPAGFTANQYYFTDSDDEINDQGETYKINGLGFDVAEDVTFIMETMLTSSATYAEARDVSIQVAISMSGDPCSALVETVTNAWYAVGVGNKFVKPCAITYGFSSKAGLAVNEAITPSGCSSEKTYTIPLLLPGNSTATITTSGTAKNGADYTLSATALSNTSSSASKKSISISVKNDGAVESDETAILTISVTKTGSNPVNKTYTVTIMDDDVVPVIGNAEKTLLTQTFTGADGFSGPSGWTEKLEVPETNGDPMATGKNQWGVFNNKLAITGKEGLTNTQYPAGTYNSNSQSQTIIRSPLIDARGLSLVSVKFDYNVQGEVDVTSPSTDLESLPIFDYMAVTYSLDGVNFVELNTGAFKQFASALPDSGTFSASLPASLGNSQFYLGFRWSNDGNAGGPRSVLIDNLSIKASPRTIENTLTKNASENVNAGEEVYYYNPDAGQIIGKIKNNSTTSFGCTNMAIARAGNGTYTLYQTSDSIQKVANKVFKIAPAVNTVASTTLTFYYTEKQLTDLEKDTKKVRTAFYMYQVAPSLTNASPSTTKRYKAAYTAISGVGGYFTVTFNDKVGAYYAIGAPIVNPAKVAEFASRGISSENQQMQFGSIYPNPGFGEAAFTVIVPNQQEVRIEVANISGQVMQSNSRLLNAGANRVMLKLNKLLFGKYIISVKNPKGDIFNTQSYIKQ